MRDYDSWAYLTQIDRDVHHGVVAKHVVCIFGYLHVKGIYPFKPAHSRLDKVDIRALSMNVKTDAMSWFGQESSDPASSRRLMPASDISQTPLAPPSSWLCCSDRSTSHKLDLEPLDLCISPPFATPIQGRNDMGVSVDLSLMVRKQG